MTINSLSRAALHVGMMGVIVGMVLTGCQRDPEATAATPAANTAPAHALETSDIKNSATAAGAAIKVTVSLSPALARKATPDDTIFIFARATSGPRMPLAIVRKQVKDLPTTVVLDDSQSMNPQMKLSNVPEVTVIARVTKSGMANAQEGDLEGVSPPVASATQAISIGIDKVLSGQQAPAVPHGYR